MFCQSPLVGMFARCWGIATKRKAVFPMLAARSSITISLRSQKCIHLKTQAEQKTLPSCGKDVSSMPGFADVYGMRETHDVFDVLPGILGAASIALGTILLISYNDEEVEKDSRKVIEVRNIFHYYKLQQSCRALRKRMCLYAYLPTCEPCKAAWPQLERRIQEWQRNSDVVFLKVDLSLFLIDFAVKIYKAPTLKLFDVDGVEVDSFRVTSTADLFCSRSNFTFYELDAAVTPIPFTKEDEK